MHEISASLRPFSGLRQMAGFAVALMLLSQLCAFGFYFGLRWKEQNFLAQAVKTHATLLGVTADPEGYRVRIEYPIGRQVNQATILLRDPPLTPLHEKITVYVDPQNFWRVEIPGDPPLSLLGLELLFGGFSLCFLFCVAMGTVAAAGEPEQHKLLEHQKSA